MFPYVLSRITAIEPLIGGLRPFIKLFFPLPEAIEPLIGGLIRPCGNEELEMRNEK